MHVNYLTLAGGLFFLALSVLSVFRTNLVWGRPPPGLSPERRARLVRRRQIGTVVFFAVGAALLILSTR